MDSASLGFEPRSIFTFHDLPTTDVATSRLPKKLGHLVEVNHRGHNVSYIQWGGMLYAFFFSQILSFTLNSEKLLCFEILLLWWLMSVASICIIS